MTTHELLHGFDFTDPDVYASRLPTEELRVLRNSAPVWWNEQLPGVGGFTDGGYWVVSRHRDIREVSRHSDVYSSAENCIVPRYVDEDAAHGQIEAGRFSMINMDAPQHTRMRKIVARGFTPRAVDLLRADLTERARRIVTEAATAGSGDFVAQVASELPLQAIAGLIGVPFEDRSKLFHWTNNMVGDEDPEFAGAPALESAAELMFYGMQLAAHKADHPGDDIVTRLITADVDGHKLSDEEFGLFMVTLTVAGNETTRNSITQGMMAFADNPDQWEIFKAHRPATTADEIIRWATPITAFQRTASRDVDLAGVPIKRGQRLALFYRSANFDEEVFDDPFSFNILRDPNPHLSFGGTGAHYCMGANLARLTIGVMFDALADLVPDLTAVGSPDRLRSGWLNGIKHWQVDYGRN
ncbi:cytochrome P450 [Candidatus Mycobacterium wuenschmannii]|uniref:Cytochrome P450 n=1 Tax=Candidatus Mycobacterium wuenschmannii TaxID=3027808 RepID=A0ABY8VWA0_9MYCO|nr:cytochrome P450 [Candidatus Mycobacterium wuenschmannii]WIM87915.1 cytochrome P450 [Candidatus Mycobacterium wuenschmannii]